MSATIALLFALLLADGVPEAKDKAPALPKGVPADARKQEPYPTIQIYHWVRFDSARDRQEVYMLPVILEWPDKTWGAEVEMTPDPLCCGARQTQIRWRKSQTPRPSLLGYLSPGSSYRLEFEFQRTECNCRSN